MEDNYNVCPYCGGEVGEKAKKCRYCGEWLITNSEQLPEELRCFNWGAFLLNWIWGIMHKKYITLLYFAACIVPIVGPLLISIWFGVKGNEWAWKSQNWESIIAFNESQQKWVRLWFLLFTISIIICLKIFFIFAYIGQIEM